MSTNVLHGTGKPRIIVIEDALFTDSVSAISADGLGITVSGVTFNNNLLNRLIRCENATGDFTYGRLTAYSEGNSRIFTDAWSNGNPALPTGFIISSYVIDLPYCQSLQEAFSPDFLPLKKLFNTGKKTAKLRGFYYSALLDYSSYASKEMMILLQKVFSSLRNEFYFYPRRDNMNISYLVELDPETALAIAQLPFHQGHKLVSIKLMGLERLEQVPLTE
jgi:hypothetical protein